jgi:hypothetical protein
MIVAELFHQQLDARAVQAWESYRRYETYLEEKVARRRIDLMIFKKPFTPQVEFTPQGEEVAKIQKQRPSKKKKIYYERPAPLCEPFPEWYVKEQERWAQVLWNPQMYSL